MLRVTGISVRFGTLQAVTDVSLAVSAGEVVALLGPNGAGKSSLLSAISGFDAHPTSTPQLSGRIILDGAPIDALPAHQRAERGIGHCGEPKDSSFPGLTVRENLEVGGQTLSRGLARERARELLRVFPQLTERRQQLAGTLSGGERQMLAIARALMVRPRVLLLDEPALGLAPQTAELVYSSVRSLVASEQLGVLLVDPSPRRAFSIAARGYLMQAGRITREGSAAELASAAEVAGAYLRGRLRAPPTPSTEMMPRSALSWLPSGRAGVIRLDVPVYTVGRGRPVLALTCSVHGDEHAGPFIVQRFLELLGNAPPLRGTVHVLPAANPIAQSANTRTALIDQKDLNRVGRGQREGSFTDRLGATLVEFLAGCDLVVNLHEFEMHTPVTAGIVNAGTEPMKHRAIEAIRAFSPDVTWLINPARGSDTHYGATLESALANAGTTAFLVETTQLPLLAADEIERVAGGLLRLAGHLGIVDAPPELPSPSPPVFLRTEQTAEDSGLWEPALALMRPVAAGDVVGRLTGLPDFHACPVVAVAGGIVLQWRHRQLVNRGTSLFSIGEPVESLFHRSSTP